jgi:hypothetical protein
MPDLRRCRRRTTLVVALALCAAPLWTARAEAATNPDAADPAPTTAAGASGKSFKDPGDKKFDLSEWLLDRKGFLPLPIIVTEPAVGYGGGLGLAFFADSMLHAAEKSKARGHFVPPDIYGGAFVATENGTRAAGAGAMMSFLDDRWRYRGVVGNANVNLDFFGVGGDLGTGGDGIGYNLQGWLSSQQALVRLGESNHYVGARWIWVDLRNEFDDDRPPPALTDEERSRRESGLGVAWEYDTRDTIFTPSRGIKASVSGVFYDPDLGGDSSFETYRAHIFAYVPAGKSLVVGGRFDSRAARGDTPFYMLPFIDLRGIPVVRYQDENTAVIETELRWNVGERWALIGFIGAGRAWGRLEGFSEVSTQDAEGGGFRYLLARRMKLYTGLDYGRGPEQGAIYLTIGNAWR